MKIQKIMISVTVNIVVYIICLIPFIISGALSHGWTGDYVVKACNEKKDILTEALLKYTTQNNGKLPTANSMQELRPQIILYLKDIEELWKLRMSHDKFTSPI
jgi:hypothetical protein